MNLKNELALKELTGMYLFANLPSALYEDFRDNERLAEFANSHTTTEIVDAILEAESLPPIAENLAYLYALIVALSRKPYNEVREFFEGLASHKFPWAEQFSKLYFSNLFADNSYQFVTTTHLTAE